MARSKGIKLKMGGFGFVERGGGEEGGPACVTPTNLSFAYPSWWGWTKKKFDLCVEDGEFRLNSSSRQQSVVVEEIVLGIPAWV